MSKYAENPGWLVLRNEVYHLKYSTCAQARAYIRWFVRPHLVPMSIKYRVITYHAWLCGEGDM